jgi:hypothetical protein
MRIVRATETVVQHRELFVEWRADWRHERKEFFSQGRFHLLCGGVNELQEDREGAVRASGHHQEACVVLLNKCGESGNLTPQVGELATLEDFD